MITSDAAVSTPPTGSQTEPDAISERIVLTRRQDRLHAAIGGAEAVPARLVLMRPISVPEGALALLADDQRCLAEVESLAELSPDARAIACQELSRRYCVAEIQVVVTCSTEQGNRYLNVRTDRGERQLLFRDPDRALTWVTPDHVLVRDIHGNRFRISSLQGLDKQSREAFMHAI